MGSLHWGGAQTRPGEEEDQGREASLPWGGAQTLLDREGRRLEGVFQAQGELGFGCRLSHRGSCECLLQFLETSCFPDSPTTPEIVLSSMLSTC